MELLERERELAAVERLLAGGGTLVVEGGAGIGKTALVDAACARAAQLGHEVVRARGSELEAGFAFGVVRQLFERRVAGAGARERAALLAGPARAVRPLLLGEPTSGSAHDVSFAVLHGLYWLAANLADARPLLIAVDDADLADAPSQRWLAHLAPRIEGLAVALVVTTRPVAPGSADAAFERLRAEPTSVLRPALLSRAAVEAIVRDVLPDAATDEVCASVWASSGGNPLYATELLRGAGPAQLPPADGGREAIARRVVGRVRSLGAGALGLAQALAVLGDGCELRHAAALARLAMGEAVRLAAGLVDVDVLATDEPPRFIHPVVRDAVGSSLTADEQDALHRAAAGTLHDDGAPAGQVAAHLARVRPAADPWVLERLQQAAAAAMRDGAPGAAAELLDRALAEPPPRAARVAVLREAARAHAAAGHEAACARLEQAMQLESDPRERAAIALEVAEAYAALFRWVEAVDVVRRALDELGDADDGLAARLEGALVVCGLHDARRASHVAPALARLAGRSPSGTAAEALAVAQGMATVLAGRPAAEGAAPLEEALAAAPAHADNWDTRAALLWSLVTAEGYDAVASALGPMLDDVGRSGSARGFVATYSTLGLLKLRLGALPEADAAGRVALRVLQEGDFAPGLPFAATVLADVAVEAGDLDEAERLIRLLPQDGWPAGVGTVLIPAARGRLRLAQGRPAEALADFQTCADLFSRERWDTEMRDVGYLHARACAAIALMRIGEPARARELAEAELEDVRRFGAPRALGVSLRAAALAHGGERGIGMLGESVAALRRSPALLERAHSLAELGAALRRAGRRAEAREPLAEALELAARCGARPLAARAREELRATGARPRSEWRTGVEALTPSELRIVRLASEGRTNRAIAHELYVTLKTVEGHLSRAYAKLGIEGRADLPGLLEGENTRVPTP